MIVDTEYDQFGTPGRQCTECNSAWPKTEPDHESWHHAPGCSSTELHRAAQDVVRELWPLAMPPKAMYAVLKLADLVGRPE